MAMLDNPPPASSHGYRCLSVCLCVYSGTPYEMGYAHGQLMADRAASFMDSVWEYLEEQVVGACDCHVTDM